VFPPPRTRAFALGAIIGTCASTGRDKLTLITSAGIHDFGAWLEQLLAESTGKQGKGVIPVDREPLGSPDVYGSDRLFVYLRLASEHDDHQDAQVTTLQQAGHPVVRIDLDSVYELGGEFFRWEFATAVAGAIIGIDPFDQPDVEDAKIAARKLTSAYEESGSLPQLDAFFDSDGVPADRRRAQCVRVAKHRGGAVAQGIPGGASSAACSPVTTSRCWPTCR